MASGNDVAILASILGILVVMGIVMPWVYDLISVGGEEYPNPTLDEDAFATEPDFGDLWTTTKSILTSFFWVYSWFPAWLTSLHLLMRVVGIFIIIRLVRGTG